MIGAVIGIGPRTGTSRVMEMLEYHAFRVSYVDDEIPDEGRVGYHFEYPVEMLPEADGTIVKLWPHGYRNTLIERALFLYREDYEAHLKSIRRQQIREGLTQVPAKHLIMACIQKMDGLEIPEVMAVEMHEIDDRMDEIVSFFDAGGYRGYSSHHFGSDRCSQYRH